jgi:hypothetical protein
MQRNHARHRPIAGGCTLMAQSNRLSRRWCATHQMYYAAWADAKRTKPGKCFMCADEKERADAAGRRRSQVTSAAGDTHG